MQNGSIIVEEELQEVDLNAHPNIKKKVFAKLAAHEKEQLVALLKKYLDIFA